MNRNELPLRAVVNEYVAGSISSGQKESRKGYL